ncbi:MAG TPA: alpha-hydroxy acid oxidase [Candidatus Angelobacter sp.]
MSSPEAPVQLDQIISLQEFEELAQSRMPSMALSYVSGGAADEITLRANVEDWKKVRLKPTVLVDVSQVNLGTKLLGQKLALPVMLAPAAFHRLCHPEGELATVAGANQAQASFVLSTYSTVAVEEVAAAATQPLWFQLYAQSDRELTRQIVERAQAAGCKALCVTVDTPVLGARNRESRSQFKLPPDFKLPNLAFEPTARATGKAVADQLLAPTLTWKEIEWLRSIMSIPLLLKGVMNPDDAARAADAGVAAIMVSNHGGRNLDTLPSTAEALPRIADKLGGRLPIIVDGGIRRGTDILKAIAMGAQAVMIGRPYLHGLAVRGAAGVARVIEILKIELQMAMALTGRTKISEIDRGVLWG